MPLSSLRLHSLYCYPVKALGGVELTVAHLDKRGLENDRRWMLVDATGQFISQRNFPSLVHWQAAVAYEEGAKEAALVFTHRLRGDVFYISGIKSVRERIRVQVWDDIFSAAVVGEEVPTKALVSAMGLPDARLVYMDEAAVRPVDPRYAGSGDTVSFADGFPFLITNTASLADFSQRLGREVAMSRFRPNIVVESQSPWVEDQWQQLLIGGQPFRLPKPCARCQVVTINQQSGEQDKRILRGLAAFRKEGQKVLFGMNALWEGQGAAHIRVGDTVCVVASRP